MKIERGKSFANPDILSFEYDDLILLAGGLIIGFMFSIFVKNILQKVGIEK